jgi:hypothetical protein
MDARKEYDQYARLVKSLKVLIRNMTVEHEQVVEQMVIRGPSAGTEDGV